MKMGDQIPAQCGQAEDQASLGLLANTFTWFFRRFTERAGWLLCALGFCLTPFSALGAQCAVLLYQNQCQGSNLWQVPAGWSADNNGDCQPQFLESVLPGGSGGGLNLKVVP